MVFRDPMEEEIPVIRKLSVPGERAGAALPKSLRREGQP